MNNIAKKISSNILAISLIYIIILSLIKLLFWSVSS